jgi:Holliday junction resolvasome RuvABC endonuclease subunit
MKLIAIDGSTKKTGIAIFQDKKYVTHLLFDYSKDNTMDSRFLSMSKALWDSLEEFQPDVIYIEDTYAARDMRTVAFLNRFQGVVYAWCMNHNCRFETIRPTAWRKLLGFQQGKQIKRPQLKQQAIEYVSEHYQIKVTDDEADAICIADAACKLL